MSELAIDPIEYEEWTISYREYLSHLYENIFTPYLSRKEKKVATFEKFCLFVYQNSSGEIIAYL